MSSPRCGFSRRITPWRAKVVHALRREAAFDGKLFVIRIDQGADMGMWDMREPVFDFLSPI
jgi:hypothetical protein